MRTFEHRTYFEHRSYRELLKSPRWQKKRLKIFERDGWKCAHCGGGEETLCVHHLYYEVGLRPWEYPDDALITLCIDCHNNESDGNNKPPEQGNFRMRTKHKRTICCPHCDTPIIIKTLEGGRLSFSSLRIRGGFSSLNEGKGEGGGEGGGGAKKRQIRKSPAKRAAKFVPPTPAEVEEYAKSIYFNLDGNAFCDHYEARGWRYGAGCKMRSWKAAVRTWKNRRKEFGRNGRSTQREPDALPMDKQRDLYYGKGNK